MTRFLVSKQFRTSSAISDRVSSVMRMFGLTLDRLEDARQTHKADIEVNAGDIVYITGASGAGKSVLLRELRNAIPADEQISLDEIDLPGWGAAVDCVGVNGVAGALRLLGYAGLSDAPAILTPPANLSEGQKYRYRLACCLASGKKYVFADEFCSNLDRITAAVIAYNVRKFAKQTSTTFILASSHEDVLADLQPDVLVVKNFTGPAEVIYKKIPNPNVQILNKR